MSRLSLLCSVLDLATTELELHSSPVAASSPGPFWGPCNNCKRSRSQRKARLRPEREQGESREIGKCCAPPHLHWSLLPVGPPSALPGARTWGPAACLILSNRGAAQLSSLSASATRVRAGDGGQEKAPSPSCTSRTAAWAWGGGGGLPQRARGIIVLGHLTGQGQNPSFLASGLFSVGAN